MSDKHNTSLIESIKWGDLDAVARLIAAGSPLDAVDERGRTAAICAAWHGRADCLRVLLEAGAAPPGSEEMLEAAREAMVNGKSACFRLLVRHGFDMNARDDYGETELFRCARHSLVHCVRLLLESGADMSVTNHNGLTVVMLAAQARDDRCLRVLIEAGACVEGVDKHGMTALAHAAGRNDTSCVELLLAAGAKVNVGTTINASAAMSAATSGADGNLRLLIEAGAHVEHKNIRGQSVLDIAREMKLTASIAAWEARKLKKESRVRPANDGADVRLGL